MIEQLDLELSSRNGLSDDSLPKKLCMYSGGWNLASAYGTEFRRSRKDRHSKSRPGRDTKQKERDWAERKIRRNLQRNLMPLYAATVFPFLHRGT